jgi:hypothetical protein
MMVSVSGKPVDRTHTVRIPDGASSIERFLDKDSIEAHAGDLPPTRSDYIVYEKIDVLPDMHFKPKGSKPFHTMLMM